MEYKRKRLICAALQKAEAKRKQTVRQAESAAGTEQQTPEEYAQTVVSEKTAQAAESLQSKALDTGRISYRQFRILQEKCQRVPTTHAAQPAETENVPLAQSADRRESFKRQRFRQKALDKQAVKTPDSYRDKMQALKRQHLTRETVRRHPQIFKKEVFCISSKGFNQRDAYRVMLRKYPDVMNIEKMCDVLRISTKTGYKLLHEGKIPAMKIGRSYRIPKAHLFTYLQICGQHCRAENRQC